MRLVQRLLLAQERQELLPSPPDVGPLLCLLQPCPHDPARAELLPPLGKHNADKLLRMPPCLSVCTPEIPSPEGHLSLGARDEDPPLQAGHLDPPRPDGGVPPNPSDLLQPRLVDGLKPSLGFGALLGPPQPSLVKGLVYTLHHLQLQLPLIPKPHVPPRIPPLALLNVHLPSLVVLAPDDAVPVHDRFALPLALLLRRLVEPLPLLDVVLQQQLRPAPAHDPHRLLVQLLADHALDQLLPPPLLLRL
mmetsp:Transcript_44996/g.112802  ORF Transcript_44996/g.112802 Transcript_44996/m.112802 type:complete len:248 (-) Transcript_44996:708-1451(-)